MSTDQLQQLINLISSGGLVTGLLVVLWAGMTKRWVWGWVYEEERQRAEEWRQLALSGTLMLGKAVTIAEKSTKV